jgi:CHAT domain-containing protein/uncharacterized protein HemY
MRSQSVVAKASMKALPLLALLIYPLNTFPVLSLSSQSVAQAPRRLETNSPLQFIGTGEPQIQVLQGTPKTDLLFRIFQGAKWLFYPDSRFVFVPSENANFRNDLYPITGTYKKVGDTFEFQGEKKSSTGATASVDGVIRVDRDKILLEVTQATDAKIARRIARISQTLSPASQVSVQSPKLIQGIQVPSSFRISLQGKTEAQAFGPLRATLKILPSYTGDPNPFLVQLSTEVNGANGSLLWSSFAPTQTGRQEAYSKITVNGNQVNLEVNPTQTVRLDVSWFSLVAGGLEELVGSVPVGATVKQGTLMFSIQGNSISGSIKAEGTSDLGNPSRYEATFTGQISKEDLTFPSQKQLQTKQFVKLQKQTEKFSTLFNGSWATQPFGTIQLRQNGQQVSGTYTGRGGGKIEGIVQGNRLDFTWKDRNGSGWGFFRAIADGATLAGMWGTGTDKTAGENLIATRVNQAVQTPKLPPINDKQPGRRLPSAQVYKVGDQVEVLWKDKWWLARILAVKGGNYCITYEGFDRSWDECVASNRIRPIADTAEAKAERLYRVGFNYLINKNYIQAVESLEKSLALSEEKKLDNAIIRERVLNALSTAYAILGDYEKAKKYAQKHLEIANQLHDPSAATIALVRLGSLNFDLGDYYGAESYFKQALERSRNFAPASRGFVFSGLGFTYIAMGKVKEAILNLEEALKIAQRFEDPELKQSALEGLGTVYLIQGDYSRAIKIFEENRITAKRYQGLFDVSVEANALNNLGDAYLKAGDLTKAEANLREAVKLWESQRNLLGSNDPFKVSIFESQALSYGTLQKVLVLQGKIEAALEVAEQGRARAFADLLAQRLSPQAVEQITSKAPTITEIREIAKKQNATLVEYSLIDSSPRFATPGTVQATELLIWVIKPTGEVTFRQVDLQKVLQQPNTSLAGLVDEAQKSIKSQLFNSANDPSPQLKQLHQLLIERIAGLLPKDINSRVIFIPQRELFLVPFSALLDANNKYLIEKHTISIAPSIQILDSTNQLRRKNTGTIKDIVVVGNPTIAQEIDKGYGLKSEPVFEQEANEVANLLNVKPIIGKQATKDTILRLIPKARIIHLSTHGKFDEAQGLGSFIVLAPSGNNNGVLTAGEILDKYRLPKGTSLRAELVVLSACQTGQGKKTGDGIIGLSRSLIASGVSSVVVSLWTVDGFSSSDLMKAFYENIRQKPSKAQAMTEAMRTTMKKYPQPGHWAAFTLVGEGD